MIRLATLILVVLTTVQTRAETPSPCAEPLASQRLVDHTTLLKKTADFFIKNKRLPTPFELGEKYKAARDLKEAQILEALLNATTEHPELFSDLKVKTAKKAMSFFAQHFRFPSESELSDLMGLRESKAIALKVTKALLGPSFAAEARAAHPEEVLKVADKIVDAYLRALSQRDTPRHLKTQATRPSVEEVYQALVRARTHVRLQAYAFGAPSDQAFTVEKFSELIGAKSSDPSALVVFPSMEDVEQAARSQNPARFANFRQPELTGIGRAERLKTSLETKGGFLVTSVNAGMPLEEDMLQLMLRYAEDRNYDIIIYATNNQFEGLDPRLVQHPRIHIVSHTIQNRFFKLAGIGIMPKNQNPFASLKKYNQFLPGQTIIVGHPQLAHEVIPTSSNHVRETTLWSTGSLSRNIYPYIYPVQARTSFLAKNFHVNSFLVLEKADAKSGLDGHGNQNRWHVRPVEFKNHVKDPVKGFTDLGSHYFVENGEVKVERQNPYALFMGDVHEVLADQTFMRAYREFLLQFDPQSIRVFVEDPIDNYAANRHEIDKTSILIRKFQSGEFNIAKELSGLVQFDNAMAAIPSVLSRNYKDSNHSYWLKDLLDKRPPTHSVVNGKIMAELIHARDVLKIEEPLEFILIHRERIVKGMPPEIRRDFEENEIFTHDPQNVRVLPFGEPLVLGPEWRPIHADKHGHQGANGAKSSPQSHAAGSERSITGDSHRSAIMGGWFNIGTSTPKRVGYNNGGYSSWSNSAAVVYQDGTIQLLTYDSVTGTLFARPGHGYLSGSEFFGEESLEIVPNDNDLVPKSEVYDQFSEWGKRRGRMIRGSDGD